jgi:uncharacterized protein YggT (Ycf19 family)
MIEDQKLAMDEARRLARHEEVKEQAAQEVQAEIKDEAHRLSADESAQAASIGQRMRQKAVSEVAQTDNEIERTKTVARISQVIDFVFWIIYGLITLEIILDLIGARRTNTFRSFIDTLTDPLLAPFHSLVPDPVSGRFQFRISYLIGLVVYILLHLTINGLLRLLAHRKTTV